MRDNILLSVSYQHNTHIGMYYHWVLFNTFWWDCIPRMQTSCQQVLRPKTYFWWSWCSWCHCSKIHLGSRGRNGHRRSTSCILWHWTSLWVQYNFLWTLLSLIVILCPILNQLNVKYLMMLITCRMLRDMPTEVYCTGANTLPVKEVWMVSDVYGKMKRMKID